MAEDVPFIYIFLFNVKYLYPKNVANEKMLLDNADLEHNTNLHTTTTLGNPK